MTIHLGAAARLAAGVGEFLVSWMGGSPGRDAHRHVGDARRRGCDAVLREFLRRHGYAAPAVAPRDEVRRLIAGGIEPAGLRRLLEERMAAIAGTEIGYQRVSGRRVPVRVCLPLRLRHVLTVGRTGVGKTTLQRHMITGDMVAGAGLMVVAPEAEMIDTEILPFVPPSRWDDVVVIDPADLSRPVAFNPLHLGVGEDLDLKAATLHAIFRRLCADEAGTAAPRMELILANIIHLLLAIPGTTLLDVERVLDRHDDCFRRWAIGQCADERTRHFWSATYEQYPRDAHLSLVNRVGRILRPKVMRSLLCQPGPGFNLRGAMDEGKVVLAKISDGALGEENASLVGQFLAGGLQLAAMSRADTRPEDRRPFFGYFDEFQRTAGAAAVSFEQMFARARKYGLGLVLGMQHTGQIPESLMRDILGTVGSVVAFQVGASDARRLCRELVGERAGELLPIDPAQLVNLPVGQAICRLGRTLLRLHVPPPPTNGSAETATEVIRRSRERFGREPMPGAELYTHRLPPLDPEARL